MSTAKGRLPRWCLALPLLVLVLGAGCTDGDDPDVAAGRGSTTPSTSSRSPVTGSATSSTSGGGGGTPDSTSQTSDTQADTAPDTTTGSTFDPPGTGAGGPGLPPEPPPSGEVRVGGGSAATALVADSRCDPADLSRPLVNLGWAPSGSGEQRVVVSTRQDGLDSGSAASSESLAADRATYQLLDSQPGGVYYWRVLTRSGDGWAASETAEFDGPTCSPY